MADTTFEIGIKVDGANSLEAAATAADKTSASLVAASASATAASDAVKLAEKAYLQAESGADRATKALEKNNIALEAHRSKMQAAMDAGDPTKFWKLAEGLNKLNDRQAEAVTRADAAKSALASSAASLDALRATAETTAAAHAAMNKQIADTALQAKEAADAIVRADAEIVASTANRMRVFMNAANQEALAQQKEDADIAAATANRMSVLANAVNEEVRLKEKVADSSKKATEGSGKVNEMSEAFAKLGGPVGLVGSKLLGVNVGFKKLKDSMGSSTALFAFSAVALAAVAAAITAVAVATVAGVAATLKWAITLADKNKDIEKTTTRLKSNIDKIFSGLKIGGIIDGLSKVADLFEENSASAKAIKAVFESIFQPLVDGLDAFIPKMIRGFIQFEIWVMKAMIAIKPWGPLILTTLELIGLAFAGIGAIALLAFAPIVIIFGSILATLGMVMYAVYKVGDAIIGGVGKAIDWLKTLSLSDIGKGLVDGLVAGVTSGGAALVSAVTGLAGSAVTAAKNALGIHSPSTVFADIGVNTAQGMVQGVDDTAPAVQGSLESMVAPPEAAAPAASAASVTSSSSGSTYNITIQGGDTAKANVDAFKEWLEGLGAQMGAAVPA